MLCVLDIVKFLQNAKFCQICHPWSWFHKFAISFPVTVSFDTVSIFRLSNKDMTLIFFRDVEFTELFSKMPIFKKV